MNWWGVGHAGTWVKNQLGDYCKVYRNYVSSNKVTVEETGRKFIRKGRFKHSYKRHFRYFKVEMGFS